MAELLQEPDASPTRSRLLVILFTDLVGSTGLKDHLTTAGYLPLIRRHDELVREAVASAGGVVQQDTGDGCFAIFSTPSEAVRAALAIIWNLNAEPWPDGQRLSARAGIHLGEVAETEVQQDGGNKLVGMAVDLTSRLMSLAVGGQILLTRGAFNDARQFIANHPCDSSVTVKWIAHGPYQIKGSDEPVDVYEVGVEGQSPLAPPPDSQKARRALRPGEEQTLGWRPAVGLPMPSTPMWVVEKKLGEGGFGEVWLARHAKTKSARVFKFCFDVERLRSLKREVVLFRLLREALGDRRDISRVIDWQFDESPYFIEMEYVPGGNLADWAQHLGGIGKVPMNERLQIAAKVATALAAAHGIGILHKDIKPTNVMMVQDGDGPAYPRLADFGIGILTDRDRLKAYNITEAGFTLSNLTMNDSSRTGTRMYAPPESLADKPHTVQGDIYALGVLLFQLVVADLERPLGVGWEREVADELVRDDITACVDVDPSRRLSSAAELAERLSKLDERRAERRKKAEDEQALRMARRHRTQVRLLAAALVVVAIIAAAIGTFWREAYRQRQIAGTERAEAIVQRTDADNQRAQAIIQRDEAARQRNAARVEADNARTALAGNYINSGWDDYAAGDVATAALRFVQALRIDPTPANRLRVSMVLPALPRFCDVPTPDPAQKNSSHGRYIVGDGNAVQVINAATKKSVTLKHSKAILSAAFSDDGLKVATASRDNTARVWNAVTGAPMSPPMVHEDLIYIARFSPDGTKVVTASEDKTARVWDATTGNPITPPMHQTSVITFATFSPDGKRIVTASYDMSACVWDAATGQRLTPALDHTDNVIIAAFSPDGSKIVTGSQDKTARVWDSATGKPLAGSMTHLDQVNTALFSPDSARVLTASEDNTARVWDASTAAPLSPPIHWPGIDNATFIADGSMVLTSSDEGKFATWDVSTPKPLMLPMEHRLSINVSAFSPDGLRVLTGSADNFVHIWDTATGKQLTPPIQHRDLIRSATFSPDGSKILTASFDHTARIWDALTGKPVTPPMTHMEGVLSASFNQDGSKVVTGSSDGTARVWEAKSGIPISPPIQHKDNVNAAAFTPDGTKIVTGSDDHFAMVWDAKTGSPLTPPMQHKEGVWALSISPDGLKVVTLDADGGKAWVWDVVSGKLITPINEASGINAATFSPDSSKLATASQRNGARIWDAITGKPLTPPMEHHGSVTSAAYSPDGTKLITGGEDKSARIWDARTCRPITLPMVNDGEVWNVSFSADGSKVVTAGADKGARVWRVEPPDLSDADLGEMIELYSMRKTDATGAPAQLTWSEWEQRKLDLTSRRPELFLPPPTEAIFNAEMARTPADSKRLKTLGEWFSRRGENLWAVELLEKARSAGANIDPLMLARCEWMAGRNSQAAAEFTAALAAGRDTTMEPYLRQCLSAARAEAKNGPFLTPEGR